MNDIDEATLNAAAAGDRVALGELYAAYHTRIFDYCYRRTGNVALAEDLSSQVFLKMVEAVNSGNCWRTHFSGWLYRTAHNAVVDFYRWRERRCPVQLEMAEHVTDARNDPVRLTEEAMDRERLQRRLSRLTDRQRAVIERRMFDGYGFSEIGDMLGCSEGAVKAMQHRAITRLKKTFRDDRQLASSSLLGG